MIAYFISLCIALFAIIPSIDFIVLLPLDGLWFWYILIAGFLGFYFLNFKVWWPIKAISIGGFGICFLGHAIYYSFTSYISIVFCCYFYLLCSRIKDWAPVHKTIRTLILLNIFVMLMQFTGHDTLLNFGRDRNHSFGIVGQHMQMASLMTVLVAFMFPVNKWYSFILLPLSFACHSSWTAINFGGVMLIRHRHKFWVGILVIVMVIFGAIELKYHKIAANTAAPTGRMSVWKQTIYWANQVPLTGFGPGTYKYIFPAVQKWEGQSSKGIPYKTAHNFIIQLIFETGYLFTAFILGVLFWLARRLYCYRLYDCLTGLSLIFVDGLVHFPDRMLQTVLVIIAFLAYCEAEIRKNKGNLKQ